MDRSLKRKSELLSALATANKTVDLKRKRVLSSVVDSANNMAVDLAEHSLPRRINAPSKTKRVGFPATKTFSSSNISSTQNRQAAVQENLEREATPRIGPQLHENTRCEAREVTEETLDTTSNGKNVNVKKRRGLTIGLNTQKYTKTTGEKPKIIIPAGVNRPVGIHSSKHASMIGVLIKLEAPMQVEGWGKISEDEKEDLFLKLINKLDYEVDKPHVMECIWKSFAKQYATFRSKAHSYYNKMKAEGGVALARERVYDKLVNRPDDWRWLCDYWETEKFKDISKTQSENRAKLKHMHKLGTKSRAAHQFEKVEFHNSKNGWADEEVEANSDQMKQLRKDQQELRDDATRMTTEQICVAVLGENSAYAKSKGLKPKKSRGNIASTLEIHGSRHQLDEELASKKAELASTKDELASTKAELAAQQVTVSTMVKCLEKMTGQSMSEILELDF